MQRLMAALAACLVAAPALAFPPGLTFRAIDGGEIALDEHVGQPILLVNTASLCAYAPQLGGLQSLWERYGEEGLLVLAVPSDDFRQELGSEAEVAAFCEAHYGLTLPMAAITPVTGEAAHPLYAWLRETVGFAPRWNFDKVLIGPDGEVAATYRSSTRPDSRRARRRGGGAPAGVSAVHRLDPVAGGAAGRPTGPLLIGSEIFRHSSYGAHHPLRIPRVSTVLDLSRALGWLPPARYRASPRAKPLALAAWHEPAYLAALQRAEAEGAVDRGTRERHGLGTPSNPVFPEVWRRPATAAGGSLLAAELLAHGGIVHNPAGGTHHAMPGRASGFCYLNDAVLAIVSMRRRGVERIAYVDIDAHHPDGVSHAFEAVPEVLVISTHEEGRWPRTGALEEAGVGNLFNLPLPRGTGDEGLRAALHELIGPRVEAHRPDAIVLQCGADAVEEDPLAGLACSNRVHLEVATALAGLAPRMLVLGGGGYNPWSVGRLWTALWGTVSGQEMPERLPPEGEAVLRALRWDARRGRHPPEHWFTTLLDPPREGPLAPEVRARLGRLAARS